MTDVEDESKIDTSPREDLTKAKIEKIISMCDTTIKEESAGAEAADVQGPSEELVECSLVRNYGSEDLFSLKQFTSGEVETVGVTVVKNVLPSDVLKETAKKIREECAVPVKKKGKASTLKSSPPKEKAASISEGDLKEITTEGVDAKDLLDICPFFELENSEAAVDDRFHHKNTASMTNFFIFNDLNTSDVVWTYDEYIGKKPSVCQSPRRSGFWQRLRNHLKLSSSSRQAIRPIVSRFQKQTAVKPNE